MIDGLKPYGEMKESGAAWLGSVPRHWEVLPNRALFNEVSERDHPEADMLSVTIAKGVIRQKSLLEDSSKKDSSKIDKSAYKLVQPGDIAYNKMRAWQGAVGVSDFKGIVSPAYVVQRPNPHTSPRYLHYLLRTPAFAKEAERWSYGITSDMWSLRPEHFRQIYSCLPPADEQAAIVRFLDHADHRIRRAIAVKQKLIRLLEEQKRVIIHRAVTRGLDPDVRLKPSGVEWLGDVPDHWNVKPLKFLTHRIQNGNTPPTSQPEFYEDGIVPWYGPSSFARSEFADEPVRYLSEAAFNAGRARLIRAPALFIVVIGATAGRMALLAQNGSTNQQITAFELRADLVFPRFGLHQMRCSESWLRSTASTATIPILDSGLVARLPIAIPSLNEQMEIMRSIDRSIAPQTDEIERAFREIDLLREYRIRLIADVVTGKLDVREAATNLPEMIELADNDFDSGEENEESMEAVTAEDQAA